MSQRSIFAPVLAMATFLAAPPIARPDGPDGGPITEANFPEFAKEEARSFTIRRVDGDAPLALKEEPVLAWTQPIVGSVHGRTFIWTEKGRPEAVATIYKWFSPHTHRTTEFQSLSLGRLSADQYGQPAWTPRRAGVELRPLPEAPEPAATPSQRLRQLREMSKEFAAWNTTDAGVESELRLLAQPIYRYESTDPDLIDGALFAFAQGTDPEAFLLLEARRSGQGLQWQYGLTRMNYIRTRINYRGYQIWTAETLSWGVVGDHSEPYTRFITRQAAAPKP